MRIPAGDFAFGAPGLISRGRRRSARHPAGGVTALHRTPLHDPTSLRIGVHPAMLMVRRLMRETAQEVPDMPVLEMWSLRHS